MSAICGDVLAPGETFEHWCDLEPGHGGDHRCGDCHDVWNPVDPSVIEEFGLEVHDKWDGTCPECQEERAVSTRWESDRVTVAGGVSSQAGLASFRRG